MSHETNSTSSRPSLPFIYHHFERKSLQFLQQEPISHTSEIWSPTSFGLYRLQCSDWALIRWMCGVTTKDLVISQIFLGCACTNPPISQFSISHWNVVGCEFGLNHHMNIVLFGGIAAARKVDGGRNCHCDVINNIPFSLYLTLMMSIVRYASIFHGFQPIRSENQHWAWDKQICSYGVFLKPLL